MDIALDSKKLLDLYNWSMLSSLSESPSPSTCQNLTLRLSIEENMEDIKTLIKIMKTKIKQASLFWAEGFREDCCLHRVIILCHRSRKLLMRTGQCFLLNGFIFLGRYNDIAMHGFAAMGRSGPSVVESSKNGALTSDSKVNTARPAGLGRVMIGIGEQVYSVLLLSFFFLEDQCYSDKGWVSDMSIRLTWVYSTGFIPYVGKALNFLLLSWMYAYYCFEYKWNLSEWGLEKRLDFFETNWAFFAGFVCSYSDRHKGRASYFQSNKKMEWYRVGEASGILCCGFFITTRASASQQDTVKQFQSYALTTCSKSVHFCKLRHKSSGTFLSCNYCKLRVQFEQLPQ